MRVNYRLFAYVREQENAYRIASEASGASEREQLLFSKDQTINNS